MSKGPKDTPSDAASVPTDDVKGVVSAVTHSWLDDIQGLLFGVVMATFGVVLLKSAGLITGQVAGLSLLLSFTTDWSFGAWFFLINLPFYVFGWMRLGSRFVIKSLVSAVGISILADLAPHYISFEFLHPLVAGLLGGYTAAVGLIALFRHGGSAGGVGILALYIQERLGFRAGWFQLGFDAVLFAVSFAFLDWQAVLASLFGAFVLNVSIAMNYRRDWYVAQ
ncbi:MAG: YitT family protein [Rhodobacteraceae bacterium]|nr:YitT family protein [Paracoccaceae bacterium]